jgi:hypothetical protein
LLLFSRLFGIVLRIDCLKNQPKKKSLFLFNAFLGCGLFFALAIMVAISRQRSMRPSSRCTRNTR